MKRKVQKVSMLMLLAVALFLFGHPLMMQPAMAKELSCVEMHQLMRHESVQIHDTCATEDPVSIPHAPATEMFCCIEDQPDAAVVLPSPVVKFFPSAMDVPPMGNLAEPFDHPLSPSKESLDIDRLKRAEHLRSIVLRD